MKKILFSIFILALFLRLLAVIEKKEQGQLVLLSDDKQYDNIAVNIISGNGFSEIAGQKVPTAVRTPIYPLFLACIYLFFGHNYTMVQIVQAFLGAILCILIFYISELIYHDKKISIIASVLVAIYKPFIWGFNYYGGPTCLLSEYMYMFIIGLAILALFSFMKEKNIKLGILAGVSMGLAILTRPEFSLFPILLIFYLFYTSRVSIKELVKKYFVFYLSIILTLTPWAVRNYIMFGKFIPLSNFSGYMFWQGHNPAAKGGWGRVKDLEIIVNEMQNIPEYERNRIYFRKGADYLIEELRKDPKKVSKLFIKKILVHWAPFEEGFAKFNPYYAFILLFGAIGILFFRRHNVMEDILIIILLTTTLTAFMIFGDPRYRYPFEPYLIIFAALTLSKVFSLLQIKSLFIKR